MSSSFPLLLVFNSTAAMAVMFALLAASMISVFTSLTLVHIVVSLSTQHVPTAHAGNLAQRPADNVHLDLEKGYGAALAQSSPACSARGGSRA